MTSLLAFSAGAIAGFFVGVYRNKILNIKAKVETAVKEELKTESLSFDGPFVNEKGDEVWIVYTTDAG